jgi:hypothetical protein
MKILLSAFSCFPWKTSEPGNVWRTINHPLREKHEVWALAEQINSELVALMNDLYGQEWSELTNNFRSPLQAASA